VNEVRIWREHRGAALDEVNGFTVIQCDRCRFKHIVPMPTPAELEHAYGHEYYSVEKPLYIQHVSEDLDWWNMIYRERYEQFERLLPEDRRRVLDVGSGPGFFLLHGQQRGWKTLGMEPSVQAAAHSRGLGLNVVQGFLSDATAAGLGTFDVVHLSEVLEHVPDPAGLLGVVHRLLDAGGLVCIIVPNDYSVFQEALRRSCGFAPWWVAPPHHINYFDFDSLRALLGARFEVISCEATFPIEIFLLMGDNYVGNDELGRRCHGKRKQFELSLDRAGLGDTKRRLYEGLADLHIGRDIVMVARKPEV
jgi:SAM-dependent methyltransferase